MIFLLQIYEKRYCNCILPPYFVLEICQISHLYFFLLLLLPRLATAFPFYVLFVCMDQASAHFCLGWNWVAILLLQTVHTSHWFSQYWNVRVVVLDHARLTTIALVQILAIYKRPNGAQKVMNFLDHRKKTLNLWFRMVACTNRSKRR